MKLIIAYIYFQMQILKNKQISFDSLYIVSLHVPMFILDACSSGVLQIKTTANCSDDTTILSFPLLFKILLQPLLRDTVPPIVTVSRSRGTGVWLTHLTGSGARAVLRREALSECEVAHTVYIYSVDNTYLYIPYMPNVFWALIVIFSFLISLKLRVTPTNEG